MCVYVNVSLRLQKRKTNTFKKGKKCSRLFFFRKIFGPFSHWFFSLHRIRDSFTRWSRLVRWMKALIKWRIYYNISVKGLRNKFLFAVLFLNICQKTANKNLETNSYSQSSSTNVRKSGAILIKTSFSLISGFCGDRKHFLGYCMHTNEFFVFFFCLDFREEFFLPFFFFFFSRALIFRSSFLRRSCSLKKSFESFRSTSSASILFFWHYPSVQEPPLLPSSFSSFYFLLVHFWT